MIQTRKSKDRGHFNFGWLKTYHTFSFGDYHDPKYSGYRSLRVINEDFVQPGQGFPEHSHRDMEILTYLVSGSLEHKDSMGNGSVIQPGDIQRMSAGSGVTHSEYNPLDQDTTHLLQIWISPQSKEISPGYEQKRILETQKKNQLALIACPEGGQDAVKIHQDALLYASKLEKTKTLSYQLASHRFAWIQLISGSLDVNRKVLEAGDGAAIEKEMLTMTALQDAHFLLFNLA